MLAADNNYQKLDALNELKRVLPRNAGISSCRKPGRQERNRISRACDFCRIKKAKCDGGEPCGKCSRSQTCCTYKYVRKSSGSQTAAAYAEQLARQQSILVECVHILHRRLQAEQDPEDSNVSSPESDMSVKDIVESLGLAPVDIVEPRVELRTHKPPPKIANSPTDDGSSASARHSHVETTQSSSTREESQFMDGIDFEEFDHLDSSSPSCNTSPDPLNDWNFEEPYDPMRFPSDYSVMCDGQPSWSYPWFQGEVF
ncbi:hypothetical protein PV05_04210 [Exophiala xenobiotica]|uniref:Zn(2)-C6 fungal-type domain-containing protein n=1 Tax=Exophiala xenobiotica TaxID=348802 RepID=A0A0D2BSL9_9EURO|nr:uncharacterized protein PV05_04210 [Exophiala xenobiotica]KIW55471.1 hypothetical protein PV05_04210 [Exophiala xenobiotica]